MHVQKLILCLVSFCLFLTVGNSADVLNECLDSDHHKTVPGPEADLFDKCSPWKDRSCCTNETAYSSHQDAENSTYGFNLDVCVEQGYPRLSDKCRRHFQEDNCFYECSPNTGPWLEKEDDLNYRNEKFVNVPICSSECENWWNDCKDDYTCKNNYAKGWDWSTGVNRCPPGSQCIRFQDMFPTPESICQIYPGDFKVAEEGKPCMVLWFEGATNPNDEVAAYYAKEMGLLGDGSSFSPPIYVLFTISLCNIALQFFSVH